MDSLHTITKQFRSTKPKDNSKTPEAWITEVLHPRDPRNNCTDADKAKRKEIEALVKRGTWKIVFKDEVPQDANVIRGRFVMYIKDTETDKPYFKARFVAQGHLDREKSTLIHNSTTVRQS